MMNKYRKMRMIYQHAALKQFVKDRLRSRAKKSRK